jgi:cytochrome c biogenesis factor
MVMNNIFGGMMAFGIVFVLLAIALSIWAFVFWILMLVHCVKKKFKEDSEKIVWLLVIILTGIIGALIYYFIVKSKEKKK